MNLIIERFKKSQEKFNEEQNASEGNAVMKKIIVEINYVGSNFSTLNGSELSEIQMKLAGYSFYLIDYIAELQRISEVLKLEIKEYRAEHWNTISETIKAEFGKVSNKEQIENIIILETRDLMNNQILYETLYFQYKLKLSSINDILTCIVQRIAEKKQEIAQAKSLQ